MTAEPQAFQAFLSVLAKALHDCPPRGNRECFKEALERQIKHPDMSQRDRPVVQGYCQDLMQKIHDVNAAHQKGNHN